MKYGGVNKKQVSLPAKLTFRSCRFKKLSFFTTEQLLHVLTIPLKADYRLIESPLEQITSIASCMLSLNFFKNEPEQ